MARGDFWDGFDAGVDAAIVRRPHAQTIEDVAQLVQSWFPAANVHLESRRRVRGAPGALIRWPDIQFIHPTRRRATHIEVDTTRSGMQGHISNHRTNSPGRRGVFLRIHPRTGQIMEKRVLPANSTRVQVTRAARGQSVPLRRRDVFEGFDAAADDFGWNTPRRWACKGRCAWLYGDGCRSQCGFDTSCVLDCNRRLYGCNTDCDQRYP